MGVEAARGKEVKEPPVTRFSKIPKRQDAQESSPLRRINMMTWEPDKADVVARMQSPQSVPFFGADLRRS